MLIGMTVWELRSPTVARKGLLPLVTTRGDRLFIGLLAAAYINLAWAGLTDLPQWWGAAALSAVALRCDHDAADMRSDSAEARPQGVHDENSC